MSSDITRIGSSGYLPAPVDGTGPASAAQGTSTQNVVTPDDDAVTVELSSSQAELPPEVSAAIVTASGAYDRLAASGKHVHFSSDPRTGELSAELQSAGGGARPLSAADVLKLASGETTD